MKLGSLDIGILNIFSEHFNLPNSKDFLSSLHPATCCPHFVQVVQVPSSDLIPKLKSLELGFNGSHSDPSSCSFLIFSPNQIFDVTRLEKLVLPWPHHLLYDPLQHNAKDIGFQHVFDLCTLSLQSLNFGSWNSKISGEYFPPLSID